MGLFPSRSKFPRLILFDIEGTLVNSKHPRHQPLLDSMHNHFGTLKVSDSLLTDWRTDVSICKEILKENSIEITDETTEKIKTCIRDIPDLLGKGLISGKYDFERVPNTENILRALAVRSEVRLGLLSTESMPVTGMKLDLVKQNTALFEGRFEKGIVKPCGAFGGEAETKHELLPLAVNQYCEFLGVKLSEIAPHDVIFVGDNPHDIDVAHDSGIPIISVNTGNLDEKLFKEAEWLLPDFLDMGTAVAKILATEIGDMGDPNNRPIH